jgi:hypothetical protein
MPRMVDVPPISISVEPEGEKNLPVELPAD